MGRSTRRSSTSRSAPRAHWRGPRRAAPSESFIPVAPSARRPHQARGWPRRRRSCDQLTLYLLEETRQAQHADQRPPPRGRDLARRRLRGGRRRRAASCCSTGPTQPREPVLFCQREAAETAIFLAEVAGRHGTADYRRRLEPENADAQRRPAARRPQDGDRHRQDRRDGDAHRLADHQQGRYAHATPASPSGSWSSRPGITIRDRLRVLQPERRRTTTTASATSCRPTCGRRCDRRRS